MSRIRMGIIGMGMAFERLHHKAYQKLEDKFEIRAICDLDENRARKGQELLGLRSQDVYRDYREMIHRDDLDAFDIIVPIDQNYYVTEGVAQAGKPIICEKPLAPSKEQAQRARTLPYRYGIPIMIAENYRYNEETNVVKSLLENQEIGEVYYFIKNKTVDIPEAIRKDTFAAKEWRHHPKFSGGMFYDVAIHDIAALQHIFGPVSEVNAFGVPKPQDFSPWIAVQANLRFDSGIIGSFSFYAGGKEMQRPLVGLRIFGSQGMIYLEEEDCGTVNMVSNEGIQRQIPYEKQMGFYYELLNFYEAVHGRESILVTPEVEYQDAKTMFAIMDSIWGEKPVSLRATEGFFEPQLF